MAALKDDSKAALTGDSTVDCLAHSLAGQMDGYLACLRAGLMAQKRAASKEQNWDDQTADLKDEN